MSVMSASIGLMLAGIVVKSASMRVGPVDFGFMLADVEALTVDIGMMPVDFNLMPVALLRCPSAWKACWRA